MDGTGAESFELVQAVDRRVRGDTHKAAHGDVRDAEVIVAALALRRSANASASVRSGWPSVPPTARTDREPHATASLRQSSGARLSSQPKRNPASKASPAPTAS